MLVEKSVQEALKDYVSGKKVVVCTEWDDGSMDAQSIEDMLPQENHHYLVDVPAVENPEFAAAIQRMTQSGLPEPKEECEETGENDTPP